MRATRILFLGISLLMAERAFGESSAAPAAVGASAETPHPKIDWAAMDKRQRKAYMKTTILPMAQKLFPELDPKKFKKVTCATCHGAGAEKDFKMPNPKLPKLPTTPAGFGELQQKKPEAMKFMATKVKPTMAALLGIPPFVPGKPGGFGCQNCHTNNESSAAPAKP